MAVTPEERPAGAGEVTGSPLRPAPVPRSWAASTFEAMSLPVYRTIWYGTALAFLAFNMSGTAQSVVAYDLTGNNSAVGGVMFGQGIAMLFLNPFGGAIADRFSKRFLILLAQVVIGGTMLTLAALIALDRISVFALACGAFVMGSMFSFLGPTRTALIGEVVSEERIGNAMALIQVGGNFSRIGGPFLAGILLSWPLIGATGTYLIIAAIFIFVILTLYQIPASGAQPKRETSVWDDIRNGGSYVRRHPRILHSVISFHLVTILGLSYMVLMPGYAKDVLHSGTSGLGVLLGVAAVGGLVTSIMMASLAGSPRAPLFLTVSSFGLGISLALAGLAPTFPLAMLAMALLGGCAAAFQVLNNAYAMGRTEAAYYGRVISFMFLAWSLLNLTSLPVGAIADIVGERAMLCGAGLILCGIVVLLALWERRIHAGEISAIRSVAAR